MTQYEGNCPINPETYLPDRGEPTEGERKRLEAVFKGCDFDKILETIVELHPPATEAQIKIEELLWGIKPKIDPS